MTNSRTSCSEGRDPAQLLAYMEGELDRAASTDLEAHLRACAACSREYESLRKADRLLKVHPDAFHPDEDELYRFVAAGEDVDQRISSHLASCQDCSDDVDLLREMLQVGVETPAHVPEMPQRLIKQLKRPYTPPNTQGLLERLYSPVIELMRLPFRMPVLALGTAAAVVVFVIVSIPLWQTFKHPEYLSPRTDAEQLKMQERKESDVSGLGRSRETTTELAPAESPEGRMEGTRIQEPAATAPEPARQLPASAESDKLERRKAAQHEARPVAPRKAAPAVSAPEQKQYSAEAVPPSAPPTIQEREMKKDQELPLAEHTKPKDEKGRSQPRMVLPKADHVKTKKSGKAEPPQSPREEAPASADFRFGLADALIPLSVRVADSNGKTIPWLKFSLPQDLASRYRLVPEVELEKQARLGAAVSRESASISFQDASRLETRITVLVRERSGVFDLEAKLFEPGSTAESKRIDAVEVGKEHLSDSVASLVASLLNAGQ